jgi:hypothetical protein
MVAAARLSMFLTSGGRIMAADYSYRFFRVTFSGTCFNGAEDWSTGLQIGEEGGDQATTPVGMAEQIATKWETFFENSAHHIASTYKSVLVKVALINTNGTTDEDNIDYYNFPGTVQGGSSDPPMPPQITLAATMTSDFQRGLAAKGRMYLPGIAHSVEATTGRLPSSMTETLNTGFKTFLDAINADTDIPGNVIIASKGHKTDTLDANGHPVYVDGRNAEVTGCRIGSVYDTQRRRRNHLGEAYNTKVLA